jgi:hypothetical protein
MTAPFEDWSVDGLTQLSGLSQLSGIEDLIETQPAESVSNLNIVDDAAASVMSVPDDRSVMTRCIVTLFFNDTAETLAQWALDPASYFNEPEKDIKEWVGQFELCPTTNHLHAHIHVEFTRQLRFQFIRDQFSAVSQIKLGDIKKGRGRSKHAVQCAVNYCIDPNKRHPEEPFNEAYLWPSNKTAWEFDQACADKQTKKKPTKEQTIEEKIAMIDSFPYHVSWEDIIHSSEENKVLFFGCSASERYHKTRHAAQARRAIETVEIHFGAGGTGKSTFARQLGAKLGETTGRDERYTRNYDDGLFWGGGITKYAGQACVHLEEFEGQETLSKFKEICDIGNYGPNVNVKNGGTILNHSHVVVTSNTHPAGFYKGAWTKDPKQFAPFWRRITKVVFYPSHLPDGNMNTPKCDDDVYCIDQTEEWKALQGNYEDCLKMAERDWALRDEDLPGSKRMFEDAFSEGFVLPQPRPMQRSRAEHNLFDYARTGRDPTRT